MTEQNEFVLRGPEPFEPLPGDTLGQMIYKSLTNVNTQKNEAFTDAHTGESITYQTILNKSCNLAEALKKNGCDRNTTIGISSENCLEFFIPLTSTLFIGSIVVPVNPSYTQSELEHLLDITKPRIIFCSENNVYKFLDVKKKLNFITNVIVINSRKSIGDASTIEDFIRDQLGTNDVLPESFQPVNEDPATLSAFILCSSGTTGLPKGVMISHKNVATKVAHARDPKYRFDTPNIMGYLPFYHGYGLNLGITCLITQHRIIFLRRFDEDLFLKTIQEYRISVLPLAPPTAVFLSKTSKFSSYDLSSVKTVLCGAAPLSKYTEDSLRERLNLKGICQGYGLTEAYEGIAKMDKNDSRLGSCGKLMTFVSCQIRAPETNAALGPNQVGEICLKGPMIMMGYYNNEEATKEAFTEDGWLRTGDLGYYDEQNYFYIVDRLKELIKYNGYQVAPAELESILIKHPKVVDVAVVGLPDERTGELPLAFVVKRNEEDVTEKELQDFVASHVSPQKKLRGGVIFINEIPKNPSGKKLRKVLREHVKKIAKHKTSKL